MSRLPRVVVCGTGFGRVYLSAFRSPDFPFRLAAILARGSARSRACASHYGVPLVTDPDRLPDDVDVACVVVGAAVNGGRGGELAQALMARGIHVLQEHPLHHDELADCLRTARRHGVVYHLNTHYVHLEPVRRFLAAARRLLSRQPPLFVDAAGSYQTAYTLLDVLGAALGGVRPWGLAELAPRSAELAGLSDRTPPFRSLDGVLAGVPLTLRIQNQIAPSDPDNHAHLFHRVTLGTEGGVLTLVNTHGPTVWSPRAHLPAAARETVAIEQAAAAHLELPTATPLGPATGPSFREILETTWPDGIRRALGALQRAIVDGEDPLRRGQYHLTLCRLWEEVKARLGPPDLLAPGDAPRVLSADELETG